MNTEIKNALIMVREAEKLVDEALPLGGGRERWG